MVIIMNVDFSSNFKTFYNNINLTNQSKDNDIERLVKDNLEVISKLNSEYKDSKLTFKSNGHIEPDNWRITRMVRGFLQRNVINYSEYDDNIKNLEVYTDFIKKYFEKNKLSIKENIKYLPLIIDAINGLRYLKNAYEKKPENIQAIDDVIKELTLLCFTSIQNNINANFGELNINNNDNLISINVEDAVKYLSLVFDAISGLQDLKKSYKTKQEDLEIIENMIQKFYTLSNFIQNNITSGIEQIKKSSKNNLSIEENIKYLESMFEVINRLISLINLYRQNIENLTTLTYAFYNLNDYSNEIFIKNIQGHFATLNEENKNKLIHDLTELSINKKIINIVQFIINNSSNLDDNTISKFIEIGCEKNNANVVKILMEKYYQTHPNLFDIKKIFNFALKIRHHDLLKYITTNCDAALWNKWNLQRPIHLELLNEMQDCIPSLFMKDENARRLANFFLEEKMICARFGIPCTISISDEEKIDFEGLVPDFSLKKTRESLNAYIDHLKTNDPRTSSFLEYVLKVVNATPSNTNSLGLIFFNPEEDIISIPAGWDGHGTYITISKGHNLLLKSNRGGRKNQNFTGTAIYEINQNEEELLRSLILAMQACYKKDKEYFLEQIDEDLNLFLLDTMAHKPQKMGNCVWASAKLSVRNIIFLASYNYYLKTNSQNKSIEMAKLYSKELYKAWTKFDRETSLVKFFNEYENEILKITSDEKVLNSEGIYVPLIMRKILEKLFDVCLQKKSLSPLDFLFTKTSLKLDTLMTFLGNWGNDTSFQEKYNQVKNLKTNQTSAI